MQLTIDLPPALQHWVDLRLADGDYADAADYLRDLVRRDRNGIHHEVANDDAAIRALVEEGLASGVCDEQPEAVIRRLIANTAAARG